ncbi:DNA cytosine methyltransferase [Bifidobacterium criceti]|uniref:Cytosine-specific methyltransferase n=1 Tax=Bifidobacterium criceti TaxID=1960969 RepID=A0A2A2EJ80_9BIFI|nr:DNA cytosine methyltransferase [Bifidobacterium criceti]PAU69081.1 modification methylase [Bifidobacterium criceti]
MATEYTDVELCAGAGGQAYGLELAGFKHVALVEIDKHACGTLRLNRPNWNVIEADLREWDPSDYKGVDLISGGVPCPPFSVAGRQLGELDERELFNRALEIIRQVEPRGVMLENVRGLLDPKFDVFRKNVSDRLRRYRYSPQWRLLQASDYGVSQLRPRVICVALRPADMKYFTWPEPDEVNPPTVGALLEDLMAADGWKGAAGWARRADAIAPTLVGGSKLHGGADLGPTRAKRAWAKLGVDGKGIADGNPPADAPNDFTPRLTVRMAARIQGFDDGWKFVGRKTASYRQIGNAFPPAVARRVGQQIIHAWEVADGAASVVGESKADLPR